jgi:hypothetical protein
MCYRECTGWVTCFPMLHEWFLCPARAFHTFLTARIPNWVNWQSMTVSCQLDSEPHLNISVVHAIGFVGFRQQSSTCDLNIPQKPFSTFATMWWFCLHAIENGHSLSCMFIGCSSCILLWIHYLSFLPPKWSSVIHLEATCCRSTIYHWLIVIVNQSTTVLCSIGIEVMACRWRGWNDHTHYGQELQFDQSLLLPVDHCKTEHMDVFYNR